MTAERRALQAVVAAGGLVPVSAGLGGVLFGTALTGDASGVDGDSHFRYLSGLLFAIGVGFWSTIPSIETKTRRFRLLSAAVFVGGIGRLIGLAVSGLPGRPMLAALAMELVVTPLLCLWQGRVARLKGPRL